MENLSIHSGHSQRLVTASSPPRSSTDSFVQQFSDKSVVEVVVKVKRTRILLILACCIASAGMSLAQVEDNSKMNSTRGDSPAAGQERTEIAHREPEKRPMTPDDL